LCAASHEMLGFFIASHSCQGIVTKFTLRAHLQGDVWVISFSHRFSLALISSNKGGIALISSQYFNQVSAATSKFQQLGVTDTKAAVLPVYAITSGTVGAARFFVG
jgi:hypothetical protein